jgi:hypothetical protein
VATCDKDLRRRIRKVGAAVVVAVAVVVVVVVVVVAIGDCLVVVGYRENMLVLVAGCALVLLICPACATCAVSCAIVCAGSGSRRQ